MIPFQRPIITLITRNILHLGTFLLAASVARFKLMEKEIVMLQKQVFRKNQSPFLHTLHQVTDSNLI